MWLELSTERREHTHCNEHELVPPDSHFLGIWAVVSAIPYFQIMWYVMASYKNYHVARKPKWKEIQDTSSLLSLISNKARLIFQPSGSRESVLEHHGMSHGLWR
jgi:hypothetical protein